MNIAAIIAEYNPFHSGHGYHIQKTREICDADAVICIMSSSFVQRGAPACLDKFVRTRLALEGGADMVLELPGVYSLQSAEFFARGAVRLLGASGMVNSLSFGVERYVADAEPAQSNRVRARLDAGQPYSRALGSELSPNSLLGAEYIRAVGELAPRINTVQVLRRGAGHDSMLESRHLSASNLRARMLAGEDVSDYTAASGEGFVDSEQMLVPVLCALRSMSLDKLRGISQVSEGLEYVIKEAARDAESLDELIKKCKSKRYTYSRLARIMCCAFLGITKEMTDAANQGYPFIRVLGVKKEKKELLSELTRRSSLPVCINTADFIAHCSPEAAEVLRKECEMTDLRAALAKRRGSADFTEGLIII
ncbi:MAG: nucleotidyltransferase family protein [Clostridia bacterium]|nr:nucleotidyltransferase family protein [Clostridia bacterium]